MVGHSGIIGNGKADERARDGSYIYFIYIFNITILSGLQYYKHVIDISINGFVFVKI